MVRFKSAAVAAILALGLIGSSPAFAGDKNGGGDNGGGGHSKNGGGGHNKNGGGGGGGGGGFERRIVVCVINGRAFYVRKVADCAAPRVVVGYKVKKYSRTVHYAKRRLPYCGPSMNKNGGDYVIGGGGFVGSPAAVAQARRRAGGAVEFSGEGYDYVGEPVYYNEPVSLKRHKRKLHRGAVYSGQYSGYDTGVVLHYGPAIVKGGGY